jgi:hypothetical protein
VTNLQLISNASSNAITLSNNLSNTNANGSITLQANSLSLGTATITANSSNGTVTILPVLASTTIGLANSAANINLSQTNLTNITAGTLIIGSTSGGMTGSITIGTSGGSTTVSVGNVSNLLLANTGSGTVAELSSNTLSVGGGSGNLAVSTAGSITLGNANAVSGKVALSAGGTVTFKTATGFTIDTVSGIHGINASGQTVTLNTSTSGQTITQNQPVTASALELLGLGNTYTLTNTSNNIGTLAANVGSSGSISLTDSSALAIGTVNTAGITTGALTLAVSSGNLTQSQAVTTSGAS